MTKARHNDQLNRNKTQVVVYQIGQPLKTSKQPIKAQHNDQSNRNKTQVVVYQIGKPL
jgi:hypothetical protein